MEETTGQSPDPPSVWQRPPPGPVRGPLARPIGWVRRPLGPYVLAVLLALLSLPVVLLDVKAWAAPYTDYRDLPLPPTDPGAISAALLAVVLAAIAGSLVGLRFVRSNAVGGWVVTVVVAWFTAILVLPVGPTLAGLPYHTAQVCIDGCRAWITSPGIGAEALALGWWLSPFYAPWTLLALAVGAAIWAWIVRLSMRPVDAAP